MRKPSGDPGLCQPKPILGYEGYTLQAKGYSDKGKGETQVQLVLVVHVQEVKLGIGIPLDLRVVEGYLEVGVKVCQLEDRYEDVVKDDAELVLLGLVLVLPQGLLTVQDLGGLLRQVAPRL